MSRFKPITTDIKDIHFWLDVWNVPLDKCTIHPDGIVDVRGNVTVDVEFRQEFPFQFGEIHGNFKCTDNWLTSLEGAPRIVHGEFNCSHNNLTSLEHGPISTGEYLCLNNDLSSFDGIARNIKGKLKASHNKITSLVGIADKIVSINEELFISTLTVTEGGLGLLLISGLNGVVTLRGKTPFKNAMDIVNDHLKHRDVFACQQELIDAGLEAFAQL